MNDLQSCDGNPETFRDLPVGVDVAYLRFLRWLIEQDRLEHLPAGPPAGRFACVTQR
jgi:hypothetical protein